MARFALRWLAPLLLLQACGPPPLPPAKEAKSLVVIVRPGPTTWFPGPDGEPAGFDHDLLLRFAAERGQKLTAVTADSATDLLAKIGASDAYIGAGGLFRPADHAKGRSAPPVLWTSGYHAVEPVLIYNSDGYKPKRWSDLAGAKVAFLENTGVEAPL